MILLLLCAERTLKKPLAFFKIEHGTGGDPLEKTHSPEWLHVDYHTLLPPELWGLPISSE